MIASLSLGPVQFDTPVWLWLIPILFALTFWIGRSSLAGLGRWTRWTALVVRLVVIAMLCVAVSDPHLREGADDVAVMVILDASDSIPSEQQNRVDRYIEDIAAEHKSRADRLGIMTVAKNPHVQSLPSPMVAGVERMYVGATDGTNLDAALRIALATRPSNAATRIVIVSDGNETEGSILQAGEAAKAAEIPIDVVPLTYRYAGEVIVERVNVPATARKGQPITVQPVLRATKPTSGTLTILQNGTPIDLDPDSPGHGVRVDLRAGTNADLRLTVPASRAGPQEFEVVWESDNAADDAIVENNRSGGVTFVSGEGRVLVLRDDPQDSGALVEALRGTRIAVEERSPEAAPVSLVEMNEFDAVVMVNQLAYSYSEQQQEALVSYVHDSGGGLVMIGGENSFGAGGWIGSPVEAALPIQLDPPQKRQMPRGALAIIVHSVEMNQGVFYGKKVCEAAVDALSRLDLVGIVEYSFGGGTGWVLPLAPVGDRVKAKQAIQNLTFGDMPTFTPSLRVALNGLKKADAGQKHVIIISDGDPSMPSPALVREYVNANVSISAVAIASHGMIDLTRMQQLAKQTNGRFYNIRRGQEAQLPRIFIKEAQTIRRSLIWEGAPFVPARTAIPADPMAGIGAVPPISGYVVAAQRDGLAVATLIGKENDPVCAQWQHGLGKVVTYTSDATTKWGSNWVAWDQYQQFWEQHVRWAMRPSGSATVDVVTQNEGDETLVVVRAFAPGGEPLNFAEFRGRVAGPDGEGQDVTLKATGPGRYEGRFRSDDAGSYMMALRYAAPGQDGGSPMEGSVQASISRPFADEFRTLEDNAALLRQVAELTGGRELPTDPRLDEANIWRREGLSFPVATQPIWIALTLLGIVLFLGDVAVRRVRIEPKAIAASLVGLFQAKEEKKGAETASLRAARAKARAQMASSENTAKRKFEAAKDAAVREDVALSGEAMPTPMKPKPTAKPKADDEEEEGISRLMKAKQRARGTQEL